MLLIGKYSSLEVILHLGKVGLDLKNGKATKFIPLWMYRSGTSNTVWSMSITALWLMHKLHVIPAGTGETNIINKHAAVFC